MSAMSKIRDLLNMNDDYEDENDYMEEDYDDDDGYEEDYDEEPLVKRKFGKSSDNRDSRKNNKSSKVTSYNQRENTSAINDICIFKPTSTNDMREISQSLIDGTSIILNLVGMDVREAQRIIDFVSGACYAVDGNFQKAEDCIFVVTPKNVVICGDLQEVLNGELGVPEIQSDY